MKAAPSIPDFTLLRRIGGGGYGEVWLGRSVTGVLRAVKVIERARFEDDRPFFRELEGITRFQQGVGDEPRQLALLHVGRNDAEGILYCVMELADDAAGATTIDPDTYVPLTLRELRVRRGSLPAADCVRLGTELASALGDLHQAGLLHRDVKPSNVILVDGRAKLADIGLIATTEQTVSSVGTPEYAAPEGTGSVRADLYSLGKILYELATGMHPAEFPRLPADLPNRPDATALVELNEVVLRACHSDPAERYPNAEALLSDLRLLQAGRSVQELNRTRRRLRALSWIGAIAGACAVVVIAILGVRNYFALRALAAQETAFRKSAEADERLARYVSDMHFAQLGLAAGDLGAARTALRRQIPATGEVDLRGPEWNALWHQSEGRATRIIGEPGGPPITALALLPDGMSAAAIERGTPNRAVMLHLGSGARRVVAENCQGLAGVTADGKGLIVTLADKTVCTVDVATGDLQPQRVRGRLAGGLGDGRTILLAHESTEDDTLFLWDVAAESRRHEWKPGSTHADPVLIAAAASRDAGKIAAVLVSTEGAKRFDEIVLHDVISGREDGRITTLSPVTGVKFSPDGSQLAITTGAELFVTSIASFGELRRIAPLIGQAVVEFSPDGSRVATAGASRLVSVWSLKGAANLAGLDGHEAEIRGLTWTADGTRLVTASQDGTVRLWEPDDDPLRSVLLDQWSEDLGSVTLSHDGAKVAVTNGDGRVILMETHGLRPLSTLPEAFHPLAFSPDGRVLLSLSHDYTLVQSALDEPGTPALQLGFRAESRIMSFGLSPDRRFVAFGLDTGQVQVWDLHEARAVTTSRWSNRDVTAIAISNGGDQFAASDAEGNLQIISTRNDARLAELNDGTVATSLGFSSDGTLLAVGNDRGFLVVWQVAGQRVLARKQAHSAEIDAVIFSPDHRRLLTGGADGLIVSWATDRWNPLAVWSVAAPRAGPPAGIYRLEFDDGGSQLVAMTSNGSVQRWRCDSPATQLAP